MSKCAHKVIHLGICQGCGEELTIETVGGMKIVPDSRREWQGWALNDDNTIRVELSGDTVDINLGGEWCPDLFRADPGDFDERGQPR